MPLPLHPELRLLSAAILRRPPSTPLFGGSPPPSLSPASASRRRLRLASAAASRPPAAHRDFSYAASRLGFVGRFRSRQHLRPRLGSAPLRQLLSSSASATPAASASATLRRPLLARQLLRLGGSPARLGGFGVCSLQPRRRLRHRLRRRCSLGGGFWLGGCSTASARLGLGRRLGLRLGDAPRTGALRHLGRGPACSSVVLRRARSCRRMR